MMNFAFKMMITRPRGIVVVDVDVDWQPAGEQGTVTKSSVSSEESSFSREESSFSR